MNRNNILTNAQLTTPSAIASLKTDAFCVAKGEGERLNSITLVKEFEQLKTSVKGKDFVLYPEQCTFLWKISWLSLLSSIYAILNGHYDVAVVPGGVFITSINYWRDPVYSSWRRKVDIHYIAVALTYQSIRAYTAEYAQIYYLTMIFAIAFYPISYHYYYRQLYWKSTYCHSMVHVIANIANIILYSGFIKK